MPVYEYECDEHGVFSALRKMSESALPAYCEHCGQTSKRILSVPKLAGMSRERLNAFERNEKSAHEPGLARRSSCGCTGSHTCKSTVKDTQKAAKPEKKVTEGAQPLQMQTKKTARPWMIGH